MRSGRLGSRVDEGRSEIRKVLRIARFRESMNIRMHCRPFAASGLQGARRQHRLIVDLHSLSCQSLT